MRKIWKISYDFLNIKSYIPWHSPALQISVSEHSSFSPHLHFSITQVSVLPEHFSVDPHKHAFDTHLSESPVQSESVPHSEP